MGVTLRTLWLLGLSSAASAKAFEPLEHLGANSPWFAGPNVNKIASTVPEECSVDQAIYIVRHGSRYPDPGAYQEWEDLHNAFQSAEYRATGSLSFISDWSPVLRHPDQEISQLSITGYKELIILLSCCGRTTISEPLIPRVVNMVNRLFARGYLGPNASYGDVYVVDADASGAAGNSLATSDQCPNFKDASGGDQITEWQDIYLPPITKRLNGKLSGNLTLTDDQVSLFPYLCGFETQITGQVSPWCDVFTKKEILEYEYAQDLRYYYGTAEKGNDTLQLPPLVVAFTHDNQLNELASLLGVFDDQKPLASNKMDQDRIYVSSNVNPMRGTIAFERLTCTSGGQSTANVRILLNDAVYPIPSCRSGPGSSCPVDQYVQYVAQKRKQYGSFASVCGLPEKNITTAGADGSVTFFTDLTLPFLRVVKP
ncbi:unnamed protein product [Aspergillus oryzae RIB40]|uniref:3-phytase n=1 Tax=Aspergillus oryzae (strain ATCC 42149 / RIB 40) TaxID=510516 RepID=Q2UHE3_ASPOR|nr:unnamed protein product [Aspergillus oryzae RIB40]BAE59022.1 unnamed protein product [Aspergillus oryzae RIB40]